MVSVVADTASSRRRAWHAQRRRAGADAGLGCGRAQELLDLGANASYASPPDLLTPLQFAALEGHEEVVAALLAHGVDVNCTDAWGRSALHWAAYNGHTAVARRLFAADADVMAKTKGGTTPYGMAALFMHTHDDVIAVFRDEERKYNAELGGFHVGIGAKAKNTKQRRSEHPLASAYD